MAKIYTESGYLLGEVISALQKEIRKANEEEAMFWALELVPRYEQYLWKRLTVIVNEDISIANPTLLMLVPIQSQVYANFREEGRDGSARLVLANVILAMCRSPKSRIADHFQCAVLQDKVHSPNTKPIPDYALDKHTSAGRKMGRGVDHWLEEGCSLTPTSDVDDPYEERAAEWWSSPNFEKVEWGKRSRKSQTPIQGDMFDELFVPNE